MKKILFFLPLLLTLLLLPTQAAQLETRGVWVSSVYNLDYPSRPGLSAEQLRQEADELVKNAREWGLNAIFLQVRPNGDALYQSEIDPWSAYLSGTQGQAPAESFDPLAYFVEICHEQGLELHAWLNPYRLTRTAKTSREEAFALLSENHPARGLSDCVVFHSDGCLYYDPGRPEARAQILSSITEIVEHYAVDGIHLDDYFYPNSEFADQQTLATLGGDFTDPGDFRRDAVNQLIDSIHKLVEAKLPQGRFGVSPAGIWATAQSMPLGADTNGSQSYFDHYADSRKWVREGMVDYLAPQIYWEIGAEAGDFQVLLDWWCQAAAGTNVDLFIGLAAYKSAEAQPGSVWYGPEELQRQLDAILASNMARGALFFRYHSLKSNDLASQLAEQLAISREIRQPRRPETLCIDAPGGNQAVASGKRLTFSCSAPRGSQVTVFYGSSLQRLRSDLNGGYSGSILAETPYHDGSYTAPALVCAEKYGILTVQLTPFTITSVVTEGAAAIENIEWSQTEQGHQVVFDTQVPCAAKMEHSGDVISLEFSPCRLGVLFDDRFFADMEVLQQDDRTTYRLVLPDDGQPRSVRLLWGNNRITLLVQTNPPALPADDP